MAGNHVGCEFITHCFCKNYGMEEHGGLGDTCLLEVILCAVEHQVGDTEAENIVCFFKKVVGGGVVFVEVFAHAYELSALAGENKCFHSFRIVFIV